VNTPPAQKVFGHVLSPPWPVVGLEPLILGYELRALPLCQQVIEYFVNGPHYLWSFNLSKSDLVFPLKQHLAEYLSFGSLQ
jgi:hypothetical protein